MANVCMFDLQIAGNPKQVLQAFQEIFDKDSTFLFPRTDIVIWKANALASMKYDDKISSFRVYGECDWSLYTSLVNEKGYKGTDKYRYSSLQEFSTKYKLSIEAISREGDLIEHYHIVKGKVLVEETLKSEKNFSFKSNRELAKEEKFLKPIKKGKSR